jgi:serine/threonine protein kinase
MRRTVVYTLDHKVMHGPVERVDARSCSTCAGGRPDEPVSRALYHDGEDMIALRWRQTDDGGWTCKACRKVRGEFDKPQVPTPRQRLYQLVVKQCESLQTKDTLTGAESVLPEFEILRVIERGGSATVFEAKSPGGVRVAVKMLSRHVRYVPEAEARLEAEVHALSTLDHPHVVKILEHRDENDIQALVMALVEGVSARELLERDELSRNAVLSVMMMLCEGLWHCHRRGIVHRDLKPENLLVVTSGPERGWLKIVDFGIAKILSDDWRMTQAGVGLGSAGYQAPEQREGWIDVDERVDVWGAAVVFHELLCGVRPPVDDGGRLADRERVEPFADLIERALAQDRDERFATIAELRQAILDAAEA